MFCSHKAPVKPKRVWIGVILMKHSRCFGTRGTFSKKTKTNTSANVYPGETKDPTPGQAFPHVNIPPAAGSYRQLEADPSARAQHVCFSLEPQCSCQSIKRTPTLGDHERLPLLLITTPTIRANEWAWRKSKIMSALHPFSCLASDWAVQMHVNTLIVGELRLFTSFYYM